MTFGCFNHLFDTDTMNKQRRENDVCGLLNEPLSLIMVEVQKYGLFQRIQHDFLAAINIIKRALIEYNKMLGLGSTSVL